MTLKRHILSKSTFIRGMQCPKSLYLHKKRPFLRDRISAEQLAKFKRGTDVGVLARDLFPGGVDMSPRSPSQYQKKVLETQQAINNHDIDVIYEAVFQYDDTLIMLDILVRDANQWKAYEVKSSRALSETYYTDASLQYYVLHGTGLDVADFSLIYINQDYELIGQLELQRLFKFQSVLEYVKTQSNFISGQISKLKETLQLKNSPKVPVGWHCNKPYPCDFIGHCWKDVPHPHIFKLTAFDPELIATFAEKGLYSVDQIDDLQAKNEIQKAQLKALATNSMTYDSKQLEQLISPINMAETAFLKVLLHAPAVPQIEHTKPYQLLPLALSWIEENEDKTSFFVIEQDNLASLIAFSKHLIELARTHRFLITDDASGLHEFIKGAKNLLPANIHTGLSEIELRLVGIRQLLETINFFHPEVDAPGTLDQYATALLQQDVRLRDEVIIIPEILTSCHDVNLKISKDFLSDHTLTIRQLYKKIKSW